MEGATRAIDRVTLTTAVGQRAATQSLAFSMRASQGGEQVIGIPADAEFISLTRDGDALNLRPRDGKLSLPVQPGSQYYQLVLRQAQPIGVRVQTPTFDLGLPLANIDVDVTLPDERWLLAAWGPGVGPAVLFWGELLLMVVLALVLSRWRASPLRWQTALLLVLGFSTYAWLPMLLVIVWLVAIDWREKRGTRLHDSVQRGPARVRTTDRGGDLRAGRRHSQRLARHTGNGDCGYAVVWQHAALVFRSQRRKSATGKRHQLADLDLSNRHAAVGIVAGLGSHALVVSCVRGMDEWRHLTRYPA